MSGKSSTFTERELQLMANAWQCFTEHPKIDFEKLALLSGYTNVKSASNAWNGIKKKLAAHADDASGDGSAATPKATPKSVPRKRGKKAADEDDNDETPSKQVKTRKGKTAPKNRGSDEEEEPTAAGNAEKEDSGSDFEPV